MVGMLVGFSPYVLAQAPSIEWQSCFGGLATDEGHSICQTTDGGYILAGITTTATIPDYHAGNDVLVVRLDALGNLLWQKAFGGAGQDFATSIEVALDGGYILGGRTNSVTGDVSGNHGDYDGWVFKIDDSGNLLWQKCIGGPGYDGIESVISTTDGGYVAVGYCSANVLGNMNVHRGGTDYLLVKLHLSDPDSISWLRSFGGSGNDDGISVSQTTDGGYFVGGSARSDDYLVTDNHSTIGTSDAWIFKTNSTGVILWKKSLGGTQSERAQSVMQTIDGKYAVIGWTTSMGTNGDVSGNHGGYDNWVVKLDVVGSTVSVLWSTCVGGTQTDVSNSGFQSADGGFVVTGYSTSSGGQIPANYGGPDISVAKLSPTGTFLWAQNYAGSLTDVAEKILPTSDGGLALVGRIVSTDGDVSGHNGSTDVWVAKLRDITPLPVELISFTGELVGNGKVLLRWLTASEQGAQSFSVLRSDNAYEDQWVSVGDLPAIGNTQNQSSYSLVDEYPLSGVNYYKLRQYDIDGSWTDSNIISIRLEPQGRYRVFDTNGRIVAPFSDQLFTPTSTGVYVFEYEDGTHVRKFCVIP